MWLGGTDPLLIASIVVSLIPLVNVMTAAAAPFVYAAMANGANQQAATTARVE